MANISIPATLTLTKRTKVILVILAIVLLVAQRFEVHYAELYIKNLMQPHAQDTLGLSALPLLVLGIVQFLPTFLVMLRTAKYWQTSRVTMYAYMLIIVFAIIGPTMLISRYLEVVLAI